MSARHAGRRSVPWWTSLLLGGLLAAPALAAQVPRPATTITGRVLSEGGAPISAALVTVRGLRLSTTTNDAGVYRLPVPADLPVTGTDTLRVTRIGYRAVLVPFTLAPGQVVVNVTMAAQAVVLEQVVVTGTTGNQERRAQAAVITSVDAADIMAKAPVLSVNDLLSSRIPGLTMTNASGTSGSHSRIDIRGQASVALSNYPLVFIDGVRIVAGSRGTAGGTGGQQFNSLNDFNPDDIESIEVVKGPAAATLYGADASAGVIQILTKRGRAGRGRMTQRIAFEYHHIDPNFTPFTNYGACSAALVAPTSPNPLCRGQAVGTVVSDNVLLRNNAIRNGSGGSLFYSAQGGGEGIGYFASFSGYNEDGTTLGSQLRHRTGRVNVNWTPDPRLQVDVNVGLLQGRDQLPQGDQSAQSYRIGGDFGSPLSVTEGPDGALAGGWFNNNLNVEAISAIRTENLTLRSTPSVQIRHSPTSWLTHRLTMGADLLRISGSQMYPKNDRNWYSALQNSGALSVSESDITLATIDYLGTISRRWGDGDWLATDVSFGSQWISSTSSSVSASGTGLVTNANNVISAATTRDVGQGYSQSKSLGLLGRVQFGIHDRLYLQFGARVDRNSAFGSEVGSFFLPSAGISYVVSEAPLWRGLASAIPTFRVRAAYGTTGRSPGGTAGLQTYSRANYLTNTGVVAPGVIPGNPGNPNLKPERGRELEMGFDAGFFRDRVGVEFTWFDKTSTDLLFPLPLPPSAGFTSNPLHNIGEVSNRGVELTVRARPIDVRNLTWDADIAIATVKNRIVDMGEITPFVTADNTCFKPDIPVAAWCVPRIRTVDVAAGRTTVSDTAEFVGTQIPDLTTTFSSSLRLFGSLRIHAQADGKFGYHVYNLTRDFRDRSIANSGDRQLSEADGGYTAEERLRRLGPFFNERTGAGVGAALVRDPYIVSGDFLRWRELSVTWTVPSSVAGLFRAGGASIMVGGRNLALWTRFDGDDPEILGTADPATPFRADVFTLPHTRRAFVRLNLEF